MTRLYSFYFATVIRFAPPFKIWDRQRAIEYTLLPSFWSFFFTALYIARQWHSWHCTLRAGRSSVKVLLGAYWCSKGREVSGDLPGLLVVPYWSPYSALPMLYYWFLSPLTTISASLLSWHPLLGLVPVLSALYKARLTWWWYGGLPEDLSDPLLPVVSANRMVQWYFFHSDLVPLFHSAHLTWLYGPSWPTAVLGHPVGHTRDLLSVFWWPA